MFNLTPWRNPTGDVEVLHDPSDEMFSLTRLRDEFESLWDRFLGDFNRGGLRLWDEAGGFGFKDNLEDKESEFVFHAELPGFEPDEIDVKLNGNTVHVHAEHKEEEKSGEVSSYRYGSFQRHFTLPRGVDSGNIDAKYHNGVLEIHLPKTEEAKGKRIPVKAS